MIITQTPFRMSFFGGGTDMESFFRENGGAVLSTTFDKYCYVNVRHLPRFFDYSTELSYSKTERVTCIEDIQHPAIRNAMKMLDMHEIRLTYEADLPARSGLGTSSSFAVGMLNAFYALKGKYADKKKLADPFIAIGKITLLQGDPGDGKSSMMMNLIAELSTGGKTPDGCKIGAPQKVIYQCSEDGVSDTIKPRLERCGADCGKIAFINEEVYNGLTLDDERIRQAIIEFRPRLVVIDPIQAYLGSDSDLQIAGRARKLMRRLGMWAVGYDCAIVLIGHLNKKEGSKGLYRSLGSIDVVAAARSVLQVERDTENPDIRIVHQIKNSLAPTAEDIRFSISAESGFQWLECRPQLFEKQQPDTEPEFDTEQQKAVYWIKHFLEKGDMSANEMYCRLDNEGVSKRVARMVKTEMGIHCYQKKRKWYWSVQPEEGAMNGSQV